MHTKRFFLCLVFVLMLVLCSCGKSMKTIQCSRCGADITVPGDFEPQSDWSYICDDCDAEIASMIDG